MANKYITGEELRLEPYTISIDEVDDKYLESLQDLTKDIVDKLCHQSFDQEGTDLSPVEKKVNGTGKDTIFLPKRLITLMKVWIYSSTTNYTEYEATEFTAKHRFISWNIYSATITRPRFRIENFPLGTYNIGVVGIWGWSEVPEPIKYLQGRLIQKIIENGEFANRFASEKVGDYSYNLRVDEGREILGDAELDTIIRQYRPGISYAAI